MSSQRDKLTTTNSTLLKKQTTETHGTNQIYALRNYPQIHRKTYPVIDNYKAAPVVLQKKTIQPTIMKIQTINQITQMIHKIKKKFLRMKVNH